MSTLNVREAAALLKVSDKTIREWAKSNHIPAAKVGSQWLFIESDLLNHIRKLYNGVDENVHQAQYKEPTWITSKKEKVVSITQTSQSMDSEYANLLGLKTKH